jgi:hypothetical protein
MLDGSIDYSVVNEKLWPAPSTARVSRRAFYFSIAEYATYYEVCVMGRVTSCQLNVG